MRRTLPAAALAAVLVSACSSGGGDGTAAKPCDGVLSPPRSIALPGHLPPGVADPVLHRTEKVGVTTFWFGYAPGTDVVAVRDTAAAAYESKGLTIDSRDAEPPAEAEFQFSTAEEEGSVQVTPLCDGYVSVRWRLGPK